MVLECLLLDQNTLATWPFCQAGLQAFEGRTFFFAGLMLDKISPVCTTLFLCCFRCHLPTYSKHKPWLKVWSQHKIPIICSDYLNRNTLLCSKMICSALWSSNRCSMKLLWNAITQMTTRLHLHRSASFESYSQVWVQEHILSSRSESKNTIHPENIVHCQIIEVVGLNYKWDHCDPKWSAWIKKKSSLLLLL